MKYGYYPLQNTLPFPELPSEEENLSAETTAQKAAANESDTTIEAILGHKDATLLFMTMAVSMTSKNEMPIVRAYTGEIPSDIRGIHRVAPYKPYHIAPHFYFDDSRILQYWNKPFETEKLLSNFKVSIGMDFSMTNEMTRPQKMYSSFLNKLWVAWLQSRGHNVIPNVSFPDKWEEDYWLEGWPKHSVIAISSVGVTRHGNPKEWLKAVKRIREELMPIRILRYGSIIPGEDTENCIYFANDNNRSANGWQ
ncbi:MAG: DUF4417 domain-containing protein [Muribaculaceae bacterium]|nr:DUF4417 domain-containing protein [Muribaculaceae bacterium]